MSVISVVNYKGGVGKTTLTANLGAELARLGKRVLLVDLDPQCSLTHCFYTVQDYQQRIRPHRTLRHWFDSFVGGLPHRGLADLLSTPREVNALIDESGNGGRLDVLASDVLLFKLDLDATRIPPGVEGDRELYLRRRALLDALRETTFPTYDYVFLDCAPTFGLLTQSALVASHDVIMPARADYLSTVGLDSLFAAIHEFRADYAGQARQFGGRHAGGVTTDEGDYVVIYTMIEFMHGHPAPAHQYFIDLVKNQLHLDSFATVMRQSVASFGRDVRHVVPPALRLKPADQIYGELRQLAAEFLDRFETTTGVARAA